jgi:sugar/nucleoside kinase (ribokinase family)
LPDVTCVGAVVADVIVHPVDRWPERGRLQVVDGIELHSGGPAHTAAVALARLGVSTALVGRVGADPFGAFLIDALDRRGIESRVRQDGDAATSITVVAVGSGGERSFLHHPGANWRLVAGDVDDALLADSRFLHLGGYFLLPSLDGAAAAGLLQRGRSAGCRTTIDLAWDAQGRWMSALAPCLPSLEVLFGNRDELAAVTGQEEPGAIASLLRRRGVQVVAVKLGEEGAYVEGETWRGRLPAFAVEAVDTTGAGDAFCAGFLACLLWGCDLEETARFASAAGAMCVTAVGGTAGVGTKEETLDFIRSTPSRIDEARPGRRSAT